MNMISTGSFLTEMDASNKQETLAEKFAAVWEKKNAKAARAGGVSLMALSLAACGSSEDSTVVVEEPADDGSAAVIKDLQDQLDAIKGAKTLSFEATTAETLYGGAGDDVFTGSGTFYTNADAIIDAYSNDSDTANLTVTTDITPNTSGVENVNLSINSTATKTVTASSMSGVNTLTLTRGDVTVGDASIAGNKAHDINALDASDVANVVIAGTATAVALDQATKAGVNLNADVASGSVTVIGAATVNAAGAGTGDTVTVEAMENAEAGSAALALVENAKAVTVNTNAAIVNVIDSSGDANEFTGVINVTANGATTVTIDDITGGGSVTATKAGADINVSNIDASGVTITAGSGTSTNTSTITLDGNATTTTAVDNATVSASGAYTTLALGATQAIDTINLSGNGAAVTYTVTGTNLPSTYAASGDYAVTLAGNEAVFAGATITGASVIDLTAGTAATIDASKWSAGKVDLGFDNAGNAITVGSDVTYEVTVDQTTGLDFNFSTTANGNVTIVAGDDNGTSTAVGTIDLVALDANDGATSTGTLTIEANTSNVTGTSLTVGALQSVVIKGDEDVSFTGVVTAKAVNASESTGIITMTGLTSGVATVTTGSGNDIITVNDGSTDHAVTTNAGDDTVTITATQNGTFSTGEGDDTINVDDTGAYVVSAGAGDDTVILSGDADAVLVGGEGTDILRVDGTAAINDNTNASINGFETFDLDAALTLSSAQWAANNATVTISSSSSNGTLNLGGTGSDTAGITINASSLKATTGYTGYTVAYTGTAYADTITGGVLNETFAQSAGDDAIEAGSGTDTFTTIDEGDIDGSLSGDNANGVVVNLGGTAIDEATIVAQLSGHLGESLTQVGAGKASFTFAAASATSAGSVNASFTQTLGGIENVTGGNGDDYIVGSTSNNVLNGGDGIDYIDGGDGADTINGGDGADTVNGGLGDDTFVVTALSDLTDGANAVEDTINGGAGTDTIAFNGGVTLAAADDFTNKVSNVESLSANGAQTGAISITTHATFVSDTGITIIDLSGDTSATGSNVIDISNQSTTTAMTLRGSAGVDTITLDAGSADTVNVIGDIGGLTFATADVINGFVSGTDKIKLVAGDATALTGNYVEVADADYDTFAAVLTAGNGALATLAGTSSATTLIAVVSDATDADAGAVALGAHVFIDTNGDGTADEFFILDGIAAATIAASDFIA